MMSWWSARAPREKLLLALAGLLAAAALLIQGVLVPSFDARDAARQRSEEAARTLVRLDRLQQSGAAYAPATSPLAPADAAARAAQAAGELGLTLRPGTDPLRFAFDPAEPTVVFSWIDRVEAESGLSLQSAELASAGAGQVAATLVFAGDPPQ
jgi:type II secretory pathway component PulM